MDNNNSKKIGKKDANLKKQFNLKLLLLYGTILGYYIFTVVAHRLFLGVNVKDNAKYVTLRSMKNFRNYFFTGWNFGLQIMFLTLAVIDETLKSTSLPALQRRVERLRKILFSILVFPSSLMVITIFWTLWHIDRELIFPKIIDDFYPSWLNHTLHTLIAIPLIVEVFVQLNNKNYRISRFKAATVLTIYCVTYQSLFVSVYLRHGVWLYPVYKLLTWTQRLAFTLLQLLLGLAYQQIGISLLKSERVPKTKAT